MRLTSQALDNFQRQICRLLLRLQFINYKAIDILMQNIIKQYKTSMGRKTDENVNTKNKNNGILQWDDDTASNPFTNNDVSLVLFG